MATVLIVEDNAVMAQNLQRQVQSLGHTILACASSGQEALSHMRTHPPDLVLMDIRLSGEMDALAVGHATQASCGCRAIYFSCNVAGEAAKHTDPTVLLLYSVTPIGRQALSKVLKAVAGSRWSQDRGASAVREQADIRRWLSVLQEKLQQVQRNVHVTYQRTVQLREQVKAASRAAGELPDAAMRRPPEAEQQTSWRAMNASVEEARHAGRSAYDGGLADIVPPGGGGEMGSLMRALDWAQTPVGPISQWPQALRTAVSICLNSRFPMALWWGRPAYTMFYNDAYRPVLGRTKHPGWLGRSGRECWQDIWDTVGPMIDSVFETGEATWSEDLLFIMDRSLPREEVYLTFSYSPIYVEPGRVGGVFAACIETTEFIVRERRLRTLNALAARASEARPSESRGSLSPCSTC